MHIPSYKYNQSQLGVGLVEILISLLLLAVAALGYMALQTQAIKTTDESLTRTQAVIYLRSAAERMRINGIGLNYSIAVSSQEENTPAMTVSKALDYYQQLFNYESIPSKIERCTDTEEGCTSIDIAQNDVYEIRTEASRYGIDLGMGVCPGTAQAKCLIASWNTTKPTIGDEEDSCISTGGDYHFNADCIYMEAY